MSKFPTPDEVIEAFEVSGLTPATGAPFKDGNRGCAMGAVAIQCGFAEVLTANPMMIRSKAKDSFRDSFSEKWECLQDEVNYFGRGFDRGYQYDGALASLGAFPRNEPAFKAGFAAGKAVREWYEAKQSMPDTVPASLQASLQELEVVA